MGPGSFGRKVAGLEMGGIAYTQRVFNDHQVRAAAGLMLAIGAVALPFAFLAGEFGPLRAVAIFFAIEFAARVVAGLDLSPVGALARLITWWRAPYWVPARPKRFAWSLGLMMAAVMVALTQTQARGALPLTIGIVFLALLWLEAVLGVCVGCEIHGLLARRGWIARETCPPCVDGACIEERPATRRAARS